MRANVNIYRAARAAGDRSESQSEYGDDERAPEIPLEEMLGGLTLDAGASMVRIDAQRAMALAQNDDDDALSDVLTESDVGEVARPPRGVGQKAAAAARGEIEKGGFTKNKGKGRK
jgi:hypothetical protein